MLVAQPTEIMRVLQLFRLALILIEEEGKQSVSQRLAEHFNKLLSQAKQIVADPGCISGKMMPQAIKFALHLKWHHKLREILSEIETLNDVDKKIARKILDNLEIRQDI